MLVRGSPTGQEIIDYAGNFGIPTGAAYLVSAGKIITANDTLLSIGVEADARLEVIFRQLGGT
jgi:uncharacterized membrane protein YkvI